MMYTNVLLSRNAKTTLLNSAIEVFPRETNGYLLGGEDEQRDSIVVGNAYPIQTDDRKYCGVNHGNEAAIRRVMTSLAMTDDVIGGFHSHPAPNEHSRLTKRDTNFIWNDEMKNFKKYGFKSSEWLEFVIRIKKTEYDRPREPGMSQRGYPKKIRITLRLKNGGEQCIGYDFSLAAYWVFEKSGRIRSQEAAIQQC